MDVYSTKRLIRGIVGDAALQSEFYIPSPMGRYVNCIYYYVEWRSKNFPALPTPAVVHIPRMHDNYVISARRLEPVQ